MPIQNQHVANHHFLYLSVFAVGALVVLVLTTTLASPTKQPVPIKAPTCTVLTLAESVSQADLILTGEVFLVVPADPGYATVLITPARVYKGNVPNDGIRIRAKAGVLASEGSQDDLHFASQQPPYLLFLQQQPDGVYHTSKCIGSRLLGSGLTPTEQLVLETPPLSQ